MKKSKVPRDTAIMFRIRSETRDILLEEADRMHLPLASYVRFFIEEMISRYGVISIEKAQVRKPDRVAS